MPWINIDVSNFVKCRHTFRRQAHMDPGRLLALLVGVVLQGIGCYLFFTGFLAVKNKSVPDNSVMALPVDESNMESNSRYTHLVFVVIDALRADFLLQLSAVTTKNMPYTSGLIIANKTYRLVSLMYLFYLLMFPKRISCH